MAKKIDSWQSDDGLIWQTQADCVTHECLKDLLSRVPGLKDREAILRSAVQDIADALHPLGMLLNPPSKTLAIRGKDWEVMPLPSGERLEIISGENHPEVPEENHPEDVGCDCGALLAGNGGAAHTPSCAMIVERQRHYPAGDGQGRHEG